MEKHIVEMTEEEYLDFRKWKKSRWGWQIVPILIIAIIVQIRLIQIWFGL